MTSYTSGARPKRAADDFFRAHRGEDDNDDARQGPSRSKKPRFDPRNPSTLAADAREPEEELILNADVIGKAGTQTKRNAVNIDGYESDSDNDNFDARAAAKASGAEAGGAKSKDEEDDDMFADLQDEQNGISHGSGDGNDSGKRKKNLRFLDQDEIEGQVMNSVSGGRVSAQLQPERKGKSSRQAQEDDEDSESSGDEEQRDQLPDEMEDELAAEVGAGGKKRHAPRLDAFNLKQEEEEGRYDEAGNYVRKAADPDAANDRWLDGLSKRDMKQAKAAHARREEENRRKALESDALLVSELLSTLIRHLDAGESSLEALQRLNKAKAKERKVPKWKLKKLEKDKMDVDAAPAAQHAEQQHAADPAEDARRAALDAITGAVDALYSRGYDDIYNTEREMLMRQYKRETGEEWEAPTADDPGNDGEKPAQTWQYRWSDARDGGGVHGPYDAATMKAWHEAGYFGEGVEFRPVGDVEWSRVLDVK